MHQVLAIVPHFPSPRDSADGQSNYLTQIIPVMAQTVHVHILALRIGDQDANEQGDGWTVKRVEPSKALPDVFALYLPEHLESAINCLHKAAVAVATENGPTVPVWCHGYETGSVVEALSKRGHHVVAVPHYLVGVETLHDLALGDDPTRRQAFDSPWATALGQLTPKALRPMGVRWASRIGSVAKSAPLPQAIQTQFTKLDLERKMVAHASRLVAVGPSFEAELNQVYPCTENRSTHVIAGGPREIPAATWPWPINEEKLRIAMVGRPTGQKGWEYAAAALAQLDSAEAQRVELVLLGGLGTGSGPYSAYSARVAADFDALHPHAVKNLGACPHTEVLSHLAAADLLLFPSIFEPLGLVLIEAMMARCCVLSSNAAGPSDLVCSPWGEQVDFNEPLLRDKRLCKGLRSFLRLERVELDRLGTLASEAARGYTWDRCAAVHHAALFGD
jgi:glycosyltransferase involved in cell wall biosynthesis